MSLIQLAEMNMGKRGQQLLADGLVGIVYQELLNKKLSTEDVREAYKNDYEALRLYNTGKTQNTVANVIGIPSGFVFGWQLGTLLVGGEVNSGAMVISGAGVATSIILGFLGNDNIKESIEVYNSKSESANNFSLNIGLSNNGVGLCLKF